MEQVLKNINFGKLSAKPKQHYIAPDLISTFDLEKPSESRIHELSRRFPDWHKRDLINTPL